MITVWQAIILLLDEQEDYGLSLISRIEERSEGQITTVPGTLYPNLKRMEDEGFATVRSEKLSRGGRPRKIYSLTEKGQREAQYMRELLLAFATKKEKS